MLFKEIYKTKQFSAVIKDHSENPKDVAAICYINEDNNVAIGLLANDRIVTDGHEIILHPDFIAAWRAAEIISHLTTIDTTRHFYAAYTMGGTNHYSVEAMKHAYIIDLIGSDIYNIIMNLPVPIEITEAISQIA